MKTRLLLLALAVALLGAASLAAACKSGGEPMTMEEYFQELQALNDDAEQRSSDLEAALDDAVGSNSSEEERIAALREFFDASALVFEDFLSGLKDLDPPEEVQALHEDGVSAGEDAVQAFTDLTGSLGSDATMADIEALGTTLESDTTLQHFTDACVALQGEADKREIAVDLECEDEEG